MINTNFRTYDYFTFGDDDGYGMPVLSQEAKGTIKMSITITSQATQDNILYKDCTYLGLTHDSNVDDSYVIQYGNEKLKVMYVNTSGRYTQVFLKGM